MDALTMLHSVNDIVAHELESMQHVQKLPEKDWAASVSGAAAVGREGEGELVVIGVAGDDVTGAEDVGEGVRAERGGLTAGGDTEAWEAVITAAEVAGAGAMAGGDGHWREVLPAQD